MNNVFESITSLLLVDSVSIDNNIFKLHYKATTIILGSLSLFVMQKQYFGNPMECLFSDDVDSSIMDTYCWIHSTFIIPSAIDKKIGKEIPHPGISAPSQHGPDGQYEEKYHKYYQWVMYYLFFQAFMFYLPRKIWKGLEGGRIKNLVMQLNSPILDDNTRRNQISSLVNYCDSYMHKHNLYFCCFLLCELFNFINVVGNIYLTDKYLGYEFTTYGTKVLSFTQQEVGTRVDPMDIVFPKVTKCTFHKYGPSGTVERRDGLCVLPLNFLNEKIYIFLWFWFIIVAAISGVGLLYRLTTFNRGFRHILLQARSRHSSPGKVEAVSRKCYIGDWFILYQLSKNMDPNIYKEFITKLANKLQGQETLFETDLEFED